MSLIHGVELKEEDGKPVWLCFGFVRLLEHLAWYTKEDASPLPDWTRRLHSKGFEHRFYHFKQLLSKFDRAAAHVTNCVESSRPWLKQSDERAQQNRARVERGEAPPQGSMIEADLAAEELAAWTDAGNASADLALYFDLLLFYLRIQADAYTAFVPFLYESRFEEIPTRSFRDHLKWFAKGSPCIDEEYALILKANQDWFHDLSGKDPTGLRDVLVHHSGVTSFHFTRHSEETEYKLSGGLYRSDGPREEDLYGRIREMTGGWCAFLDAACLHFFKNLKAKGILRTMSDDDAESRCFPCWQGGLASSWAYPSFTGRPPYTMRGLAGA